MIDCEADDQFRNSNFCQKTYDDDSIGKSCVNEQILNSIQKLFPNVEAIDDCFEVQYPVNDGMKNGTVCLCQEDECNSGAEMSFQMATIILLFFILSCF